MKLDILLLLLMVLAGAGAVAFRRLRPETGESAPRRKGSVLAAILLVAGSWFAYNLACWYGKVYGSVGFDAVLYTLTANLTGTDPELFRSCMGYLLKNLPVCLALLVLLLYSGKKTLALRRSGRKVYPLTNRGMVVASAVLALALLWSAAVKVELVDYIQMVLNPSNLYEEEYRHPDDVAITFPEKKRNLIYIFMESMETTFFSEEEGGALPENVIPELYQLAEENVNFSGNDDVGGFLSASGTTWTIGGIVGQTAGIPLKTKLMVPDRSKNLDGDSIPGAQTLTNVLTNAGYKQAAMFGSYGEFGGRLPYFTSHGACDVYDLRTAYADGLVPENYHNGFWGIDDSQLYTYAREKILEMASTEEPFDFTMLTVDTHSAGGYICNLCEDTYDEQYENVYRCASRQVADFVAWIQQQDFYENTTIVIAGDHLTMDAGYMSRVGADEASRRVYNCFINAAAEPVQEKNRQMSTFDMYPTTLAAMGCTIEGDRLALGTNLFSGEPTLLERYGEERFQQEVGRYSAYYVNNFYK